MRAGGQKLVKFCTHTDTHAAKFVVAILTDIYEIEVEGNCGYFRRLLSFIFPAIFGVDRIPVCTVQAQPALLSMRAVSQHAFF